MSEHTDHNHGDMWAVIGVILVMLLIVTWGTGSETSDLQRRVGQLEIQCEGGQR